MVLCQWVSLILSALEQFTILLFCIAGPEIPLLGPWPIAVHSGGNWALLCGRLGWNLSESYGITRGILPQYNAALR
jgi:hypothetical protein